MPRGLRLALVSLTGLAAAVAGVYLRDEGWLSILLVLGGAATFFAPLVVHPASRESVGRTWLGPVGGWLGRLWRLEVRTLALSVAVGGVAVVGANAAQAALYPDSDSVRRWIESRFAPGDGLARPLPGGGSVDARASKEPATVVAARIHAARPSEDQRYTEAGVFLRYERDIVAVLPADPGSEILVVDAETGYRAFARWVGDFWGPRYDDRSPAAPSALPIPDARDSARLERGLAAAARQQGAREDDVCFGWEIEVRSGRRRGAWEGSSRRDGRGFAEPPCQVSFALTGWVDPDANRFGRGSQGDFSVGYEWINARAPDEGAIDRLSVPFVELIEGSTTEPSGGGQRAGKGLYELVSALPLLLHETDTVDPVLLELEPAAVRGPLTRTERSDAERRAEDGGLLGTLTALVEVAGTAALLAVAGALLLGVPVRLVRLARRPA